MDKEIHPRVKDMQLPRLGKPRRGLQIFDTRVDFPVPVQWWSILLIPMCRYASQATQKL